MRNSKKFVIITAKQLLVRNDPLLEHSSSYGKSQPLFESDCACPVDEVLLISETQDQIGSFEGDCACPTDDLVIENPASFSAGAQFVLSPLYTTSLTGEYHLAFNPLSQSGVVTLNQAAKSLLEKFTTPISLVECADSMHNPAEAHLALRRLAALQLIQPVDSRLELKRSAPKTLTAWLHLTNECNLRCDYCYLRKTQESMSPERGRQAVDAVFRSAIAQSFREVKLKYAGGESTLEFALLLELHDYAREQADRLGLGLTGVVLSNGIGIGDRQILALRERGIRLSISVDGIGKDHDAQRTFQNGKGSFALVERSLDRLARWNFKPSITITVSRRNAAGLAGAVKYFLERELPFTINFYRENEHSAPFEDLVYQDEQMIKAMQQAFAEIEDHLPPFSILGAVTDRARLDAPHVQPCGVGHSYMVVDQNGNVAKCHMEIERKITDIFATDPLRVLQLDRTGIQNVSVEEKEGCRTCEWRYYCAGGCPALTYRVTGRYDVKSPNCRIYKAIFPEVLRLEGLRLLKYYGDLETVLQ